MWVDCRSGATGGSLSCSISLFLNSFLELLPVGCKLTQLLLFCHLERWVGIAVKLWSWNFAWALFSGGWLLKAIVLHLGTSWIEQNFVLSWWIGIYFLYLRSSRLKCSTWCLWVLKSIYVCKNIHTIELIPSSILSQLISFFLWFMHQYLGKGFVWLHCDGGHEFIIVAFC